MWIVISLDIRIMRFFYMYISILLKLFTVMTLFSEVNKVIKDERKIIVAEKDSFYNCKEFSNKLN